MCAAALLDVWEQRNTALLPGTLPRAKRRVTATLEYAAFLGAMQLDPQRGGSKPLRDAERLLYEVLAQWLPT